MSKTIGHVVEARRDRWCARSLLWLMLAIYTTTFTGLPDNPDGEISFQTTRSLAVDGSFALGATPEAELIVAHARSVPPGGSSVSEGVTQGRYYAWFGIGQALAAVPFYWLGKLAASSVGGGLERDHEELGYWGIQRSEYLEHLCVSWRNPLCAALTAWLVVLVACTLGARRPAAWLVGAAYGLTTFAWPQARSSLSDVQATFFLFLAFHELLVMRERCARGSRPTAIVLLACGCALAAACLTRVTVTGGAIVLWLAALWQCTQFPVRPALECSHWSPRGLRALAALAWLTLPLALALALFCWTNWLRFGSAFESGYGPALRGMGLFQRLRVEALAGLLFSPGRGLLWFAPALLLCPLGLFSAWLRGDRFWPCVAMGVGLAILLPVCLVPGWHGAWTFGPRYLLPMLPFLWVSVAFVRTKGATGRGLRYAGGLLFAAGALVQVSGVLVDTMSYHELAVQAARVAWPEVDEPGDPDSVRFERMQWDLGLAAPLAHWRILMHRTRGLPESFPVRSVFRIQSDAVLRPTFPRDEGFRHLAWVDYRERLRRSLWWPLAGIAALLVAAAVEGWRAARSGSNDPPAGRRLEEGPQASAGSGRRDAE